MLAAPKALRHPISGLSPISSIWPVASFTTLSEDFCFSNRPIWVKRNGRCTYLAVRLENCACVSLSQVFRQDLLAGKMCLDVTQFC
jgi:hypothetical protein